MNPRRDGGERRGVPARGVSPRWPLMRPGAEEVRAQRPIRWEASERGVQSEAAQAAFVAAGA